MKYVTYFFIALGGLVVGTLLGLVVNLGPGLASNVTNARAAIMVMQIVLDLAALYGIYACLRSKKLEMGSRVFLVALLFGALGALSTCTLLYATSPS